MWLLNTQSLKLRRFDSDTERPRYAILSHCWREEEVTHADMNDLPKAKKMRGFPKISKCCALALQDGYHWLWIDTCCIDKSSSAELSEAINSMFAWYGDADVCYAFLDDANEEEPGAEGSSFRLSRWFTRGWTLQELIAPRSVYFLSKNWRRLGTKRSLVEVLTDVTTVDRAVLLHEKLLDDVSVARRMSWAAGRETTRVEDRAYSLMGIFGANIPTIYGEGEKAFIRLQLEIIRQSPDQSIFAWGRVHSHQVFLDNMHSFSDGDKWSSEYRSLLASSPQLFADCADIEPVAIQDFASRLGLAIPVPEYYPTNYGIHIHLPLYAMNGTPMSFALLACKDRHGIVGLLLRRMDGSTNRYYVGLHGMYRPLQRLWHPFFRLFRIPSAKSAKLGLFPGLGALEVADMYLHSHNPNPQRSRAVGVADKQLRLHRRTLAHAQPKRFAFILHGWVLKKLEALGFSPPARERERDGLPGWTPAKGAWAWHENSLTLTVRPDGRRAVVLFRGPKDEAFTLTVGVTEAGVVWAEGLVRGCAGSADDEWKGSGHETVKTIAAKYEDVLETRLAKLDLDSWKYGTRKFGDMKARTVVVTFTPWLAGEEESVLGNGTVTYTVGIELQGKIFVEFNRLSSTGSEGPTPSDLSHFADHYYPAARR